MLFPAAEPKGRLGRVGAGRNGLERQTPLTLSIVDRPAFVPQKGNKHGNIVTTDLGGRLKTQQFSVAMGVCALNLKKRAATTRFQTNREKLSHSFDISGGPLTKNSVPSPGEKGQGSQK